MIISLFWNLCRGQVLIFWVHLLIFFDPEMENFKLQTWQDVGQGIERWSQVIAMCCLEKVSWCAVTVRVWAKKSETQYLNAFNFPCMLLMHSEFQMGLLFLGCYVDYSKSLLWWEGMRKLLSFYVSPFLFKPAMYGISYTRVYLSEVVLTVHRGLYSIRDWCFHQFFFDRQRSNPPSSVGLSCFLDG